MTLTHSKARQQAEVALGDVQSLLFAMDQVAQEIDYVAENREAKTQRLRAAREAKAACDLAAAAISPKRWRKA